MLVERVSLLGVTLEESKTPEPSDHMEISGVEVALGHIRTSVGQSLRASLTVGRAKRVFWGNLIQNTLATGTITYKGFEKLVGRLAFASSAAWGPLARGHLTSLYALLGRGGGNINIDSTRLARGDLSGGRRG